MNLIGKYITVNNKQIIPLLNILYNEGYSWVLPYHKSYGGTTEYLYDMNKKINIIITNDKKIDWSTENSKDVGKLLDCNVFFREYKLKRILK